jgi:hypothetical protein
VRNSAFEHTAPSSTLVVVKSLAVADHLVEISGIAMINAANPADRAEAGRDADVPGAGLP